MQGKKPEQDELFFYGSLEDLVPQGDPFRCLDAVLDLASQAPDASLLRGGGRIASPLGAAGDGPGRFNVMAEPTPANLQRLAELLETGTLRVPIQRSYPLGQAAEALQALQTTHTQGKLGVTIA